MPRVLRIIHRLSISGPTHHAAFLTRFLPAPYETKLVAGAIEKDEAPGDFIFNKLGVQPFFIPEMKRALHPYYDFLAFKHLRKVIRTYKPDIVHTHASKAGALGRMAAICENVPHLVHTFHGHVFEGYYNNFVSGVFINIERKLAGKTSRIVAISKQQKFDLAERFQICPPEKIELIPLGFNLSDFMTNMPEKRKQFREAFGLADDVVVVGIIGRLAKVKNHDLFLKAFAKVLKSAPGKTKAIIVGDGERRNALFDLCENLSVRFSKPGQSVKGADVIFTSWRKDIDRVVAGLDVVALSSLNEGTPVTLIEALAAQKPIVSTAVGGVPDIVAAGKNALLCDADDFEKYTAHLKLLIENKHLREKMHLCSNNAYANFSYQRLIEDMQNLYDTLLKR